MKVSMCFFAVDSIVTKKNIKVKWLMSFCLRYCLYNHYFKVCYQTALTKSQVGGAVIKVFKVKSSLLQETGIKCVSDEAKLLCLFKI